MATIKFTRYTIDDNGTILTEFVEYEPTDTLLSEQSGADAYAKDIRGIARAVWQGLPVDGYSLMWDTVGLGIEAAWREGAASCGIAEDELTIDEQLRRDMLINEQRGHIMGFLDWVYSSRRDGPAPLKWASIRQRAGMWGNAWNKAYNEAKARACADQKLMWKLHGRRLTKESCEDCLSLNGRIYRASVWAKYGVFPQSPDLACNGFNCGCSFVDAPAGAYSSRGRPPRLKGQR